MSLRRSDVQKHLNSLLTHKLKTALLLCNSRKPDNTRIAWEHIKSWMLSYVKWAELKISFICLLQENNVTVTHGSYISMHLHFLFKNSISSTSFLEANILKESLIGNGITL